jgi:enolase-phosphatase E1
LFPYARRGLRAILSQSAERPDVRAALVQLARDVQEDVLAQRVEVGALTAADREALTAIFHRLMDGDVKATGLKQLQGMIWELGFRSGELVAEVFDDVPEALRRWRASGIDIRIYSSGSIAAQKLFFGHTRCGDLTPLLSGFYDTTTGPKRVSESYVSIAKDWRLMPGEILFVSDVPEELNAAIKAGYQTALAIRPGTAAIADAHKHLSISNMNQIRA